MTFTSIKPRMLDIVDRLIKCPMNKGILDIKQPVNTLVTIGEEVAVVRALAMVLKKLPRKE